jgi:glycosyltransferase involved in cell wall biosynthesis
MSLGVPDPKAPEPPELEVSFVMPCLDEAETVEGCIRAAQACIERNGLSAEIIIADNGSSDDSREIARSAGARVVEVLRKGYGSALMGGIAAARGRYIVMGDADLSYDFSEAMPFIEKRGSGKDSLSCSSLTYPILWALSRSGD